ncbi:hypothetical protein BW721_07575 [Jeotgalibaca sp. PTS2502]|uniref:hypothetical protein n=1 Tax=Jeotgalibaca sp. PTS2502 TaxID=1903686 RepID=UPI000973CF5E|nr:hypothetical protein [Jeotgalibaca sp. PTS2502]APZ49541.1 hypothetical protein BW721_07575 [Jeotgalibaca sp. PTS2502]
MNQTHYRSKPTEEQLINFELKKRTYVEQRESVVRIEEEKREAIETEKRLKQEQVEAQEEQELLEFFVE